MGHNPDSESIDLSSTTAAASGSPGNQSSSSSSSSSESGATGGDYVPGASPITQATTRDNDSPVTGAQIALHHRHHDHPADPVAPETSAAAHLDDKLPPVPGSLITQVSQEQQQERQSRTTQASSGGFWRNLLSCCVPKRGRSTLHGPAASGHRYTAAVSRSKPVLPPFVCPFSTHTPPPSCLSLARFSVNFEMRPGVESCIYSVS